MASHVQPPSSNSQPKNVRKYVKKWSKAIMKSHRVHVPKYDLPIRFRPWFLIFTCVIMVLLAFLSFTNFSRSLPLNDKLLHFICFCIATGVFYFIFDVEEDARRIWFWRHSSLIFTAVMCFFFGGLVSEIVQSMLPYKEFQFGDVVANVFGSSTGLYLAYYSERHYRSRREIARLYRPLDTDETSDAEDLTDDEGDQSTQLLPMYHNNNTSSSPSKPTSQVPKGKSQKARRLGDVWDEREELFGIGEDSDEDDADTPRPPRIAGQPPLPPKITITRS
ncbi:hypothetical protein BJ138DRAFT_1139333 [Hygrophoropsis aurantiaca]|uniref:Uncharacterized protein n=1 Tax=Hygrophoropsis aurantiaca TaxID=72124 RepID=A0ACB8AST3_9AGAM|nr:hypothetical protein BJ138DRAFT_1139333 [Hygrophoropsis aurantiaca]